MGRIAIVARCAVVSSAAAAGMAGAIGASRAFRDVAQERAAHSSTLPADDGTSPVLRVPRARASIVLDGDSDDPGWTAPPGPARTGPFRFASGVRARPYADARMVWGDGQLYVLLYAADEDIRSRGERFRLTFVRGGQSFALDVAPDGQVRGVVRDEQGAVRGWSSGAHASREIDGTLDDPRDRDEEWSVELALPLASLGMKGERGESAVFSVAHCCRQADTSAAGVCGGWGDPGGGRLVLE
jgi:hypothetical protein